MTQLRHDGDLLCKILMPHRNDIVPETIEALGAFPKKWRNIKFVGEQLPNSGITNARNNLLWGGQGTDPFDDRPDLYLFWDSDTVGGIDDFAKMYNLNKPVVFGLYPFNKSPELEKYFVGGSFIEGFPGCTNLDHYFPIGEKRVYEGFNFWSGLGFTLIRKTVLQALPYPWVDGITVETPKEYPRPREILKDDMGFCLNLIRNDIPVVCDGRLNLKHIPRDAESPAQKKDIQSDDPQTMALIAMKMIGQLAEQNKFLRELANK